MRGCSHAGECRNLTLDGDEGSLPCKISWANARAGSSPARGTNDLHVLEDIFWAKNVKTGK